MHILCIYVLTRYFYGGQIYKAILAGLRDKKAKWPHLGGREGSHTVHVNIYIGKSVEKIWSSHKVFSWMLNSTWNKSEAKRKILTRKYDLIRISFMDLNTLIHPDIIIHNVFLYSKLFLAKRDWR